MVHEIHESSYSAAMGSFQTCYKNQVFPFDTVRRTRDRLCKLVQHSSITKYMNEFRISVLSIPDMNYGEKLIIYVQDWNPK